MSHKNDSLGDRMKGYENISRACLTRRVPVIIRLDGKAFHTFTRGLDKPFDKALMKIMQLTMHYLCSNIQGCVFGYTQSDEITLVLTDYATIKTDAWFGYNVQKMASVSASMATMEFNRLFRKEFEDMVLEWNPDRKDLTLLEDRLAKLQGKQFTACFDARCFSIPVDEVCNCLIWRQQDATRNSIEAVGQANFSHKQLMGKSCNEIQDMLFKEKGVNWNDFPTDCKRGSACYRVVSEEEIDDPRNPGNKIPVQRKRWVVDIGIPVFSQDRQFVERFL